MPVEPAGDTSPAHACSGSELEELRMARKSNPAPGPAARERSSAAPSTRSFRRRWNCDRPPRAKGGDESNATKSSMSSTGARNAGRSLAPQRSRGLCL